MPKFYGKAKPYRKKRKTYAKKRPSGTSLITSFPHTGLPESVLMKMKYTGLHSNVTTTTANTVSYRLNGLFDPLADLGGHQPYYFDQMKTLYNKYTVYGCKVTVKCATSNAIAPCSVSMKAQVDNIPPTTISVALERPLEKHVMINGGARPAVMSQYYDIAKLLGISRTSLLADDRYSAFIDADPQSQYYMLVSHQATDQISSAVVDLEVSLTFYVKWHSRIRVSQS